MHSLDNTGVHNISTVEHILSALHGLEIDNVYIDLIVMIPVCDGSSLVFVDLLKKNGVQPQTISKNFIKLKNLIEVRDNEKNCKS